MRSRPVCTSRGWQTITSTPCLTFSSTQASRRSGATVSALSTATRNPCCVRKASIRSVMSLVPVWVAYTSTLRPASLSAATRSTSACSFGYSLSSTQGLIGASTV